MKKYRKTIMWFLASTCSVPVVYLQAESDAFGINLLALCGVALLSAFLMALLPYRKTTFVKKMSFTIPLSIISFGLFISFAMMHYEYGIFHHYNYFTAKRDIEEGKIQMVTYGLVGDDWDDVQQVTRKYGFEYLNMGCIMDNKGHEKYNDVMIEYLDNINGKGWQEQMHQEIMDLDKENR